MAPTNAPDPEPILGESWLPVLLFASIVIIWIAMIIKPILYALFS